VLPDSEEHVALFTELAETVRTQGGSAAVFTTRATGPAEREPILARFRADRAREYGEFAERARGFLAEIDKETRLGKFTFAEIEEIEDDFGKLSAWLGKIRARDFFPGEEHREAADTLARCEAALRTFAGEVYAHEGVTPREGFRGPEGNDGSPGEGASGAH
jgi:hypothetical protein